MKKILAVLFCVFAVVLTLGLCTAVMQKAYATLDCYGCPGTGAALGWNSNPTSTTATNADPGNFSFTQSVTWSLDPEPTAATVSSGGGISTFNVSNLSWNPALFFPNSGHADGAGDLCCRGTLDVLTAGILTTPSVDGSLKTKCESAPPLNTAFHIVAIHHF